MSTDPHDEVRQPVVEVRHATYQYPDASTPSVKNVSFRIYPNDRVILVGANGSGKSTLLSLLAGARKPHDGSTSRKGSTTKHSTAETVAVSPSTSGYVRVLGVDPFQDTSVAAHIAFIGAPWPSEAVFGNKAEKVASPTSPTPAILARRASLAATLHISLSRFVDQMSSGEKRRVQMIHGLLPEASLFLLDECSTDIDVVERKTVLEWVRKEVQERNGACVYATHVFDGVEEWATHVALMRDGELVEYLPLSSFTQASLAAPNSTNASAVAPAPTTAASSSSSPSPLIPLPEGSIRHHLWMLQKDGPLPASSTSVPHSLPESHSLSACESASASGMFLEGDSGFSLENFARDFMSSSSPLSLEHFPTASGGGGGAPNAQATPSNDPHTSSVSPSPSSYGSPTFPRRYTMNTVTSFLKETLSNAASPTMGAAPSCLNYRETPIVAPRKEKAPVTAGGGGSTTLPPIEGQTDDAEAEVLFSTIPAIQCDHLTYKNIFKDMTFSIPQGARVLLCGCNGSGKSTLLKMLGGRQYVGNHDGALRVLGFPCYEDMRSMNALVSFGGDWWTSPPEGEMYVREMIDFTSSRAHYISELLAVDMDWNVQAISAGESKRVQLLHQLLDDKPVVLLDEATSDLDVDQRHRLLSFLYAESVERGVTVVYATHILNGLEGWPTMTMILDGKKKGVHGMWLGSKHENHVGKVGEGSAVVHPYELKIKDIPGELSKLKALEEF